MNSKIIIGITPFERPDVNLALALEKAGIFPVLHLGREKENALTALVDMQKSVRGKFGVCFADPSFSKIPLPDSVSLVILPASVCHDQFPTHEVLHQVTSLQEAYEVLKHNVNSHLIVKGNESAGKVGEKSSFILFQEIKKNIDAPVWIQGGMGIHSAASVMALGARGIVLDSQLSLFPESCTPADIRDICKNLDGTETKIMSHHRVLVRPDSPKIDEYATIDIEPFLKFFEISKGFIPMGQDIGLANNLFKRFKTLKNLAQGFYQSMRGHLRQVHSFDAVFKGNAFAKEFNTVYPIAQGPMTRVSDVPEFAECVAREGGLPFIALSLMKGESAKNLLINTKTLLQDKAWGVGILGFVSPELRKEQLSYIEAIKPPVVLIAGGRPSQAKSLEKLGIKTFLHVPSTGLLDVFLKEGARRFVFEGRECGGHVGPLLSFVLWEKQIERLLDDDNPDTLSILFAGGIHDATSAAIVSVMAAPLIAKGAKVGVLMGTSYLYTKEATASGAILQQFQDHVLSNKDTVLVETGTGHLTRCLDTPFVEFFRKEKERLVTSVGDKNEIREKLEALNVGRLRIAAKGLARDGDSLRMVSEAVQEQEGMYMIGQVVSLRDEVVTIKELHEDVASAKNKIIGENELDVPGSSAENALNVAIIGMACIYPGSEDLQMYWRNIITGKDCVTEIPDERWNKERHYDANAQGGEKTPSKWGGLIPTVAFDPIEFGIPPQSIAAIDPTQLLALKVAKDALADAGYAHKEFDRDNTSVIFGLEGGGTRLSEGYSFRALYNQMFTEMPEALDKVLPNLTEDSFPGVLANVVSGRIANRLDLGGRNYIVDAACASSLAVIDVACQDLASGKSSMVLAGGVDVHNSLSDYLFFSATKALSHKGKCMTFDAEADGIALGEGVAVMVLKRLEDANRDGDRVYAVIKGVGAASDGKSLGLTAPRKQGQVKALERAYQQSGIAPSEVGLMEAHGTGTVVGDHTELSSMTDIFIRSGAIKSQTHLGSVKTQIGHTKCAAGMAGMIKVALSIYHGVKPPTINLKRPNKFYNEETSPFVFNTESAGFWTAPRRIGGVSAFGFGGTNYHAILENKGDIADRNFTIEDWPFELLVFRGNDVAHAMTRVNMVKEILTTNINLKIRDIAYSLAVIDETPVQLSIIATDGSDLLDKIHKVVKGDGDNEIYKTRPLDGKVAFLFSGQGSQRIDMARDLFVIFPAMRTLLLNASHYIDLIFPNTVFNDISKKNQSEKIRDTRIAQPLLGIVDFAIASLLKGFGIEPDMVAGHSYGELPALCFADVFDWQMLVPLSEKRAECILKAIESDPGAMLAVSCKEQDVLEVMMDHQVYVANHNSPNQLVISSSTEAIEKFETALKALGKSSRRLEVACAFHSPLLSNAPQYFMEALDDIELRKPNTQVWSNTTAAPYPEAATLIKERLAEHLVKPVLFSEEIKKMHEDGARVFIETGPGKTLASLVVNILPPGIVALHAEQKGVSGILQLLKLLARYVATGRELKLTALFENRNAKQIDLSSSEQHRLSATTWKVNGNIALPLFSDLPAHGAPLLTKPIVLKQNVVANTNNQSDVPEKIVLEYLHNMNEMMQAQRDVILGYMGQNPGSTIRLQPSNQKVFALASTNLAKPFDVSIPSANHVQDILTPDKVKNILLEVVSQKTGYPPDMLGMDMDLEADLSIDSIKRVEIIGTLRSRFTVMRNSEHNSDEVMETLSAIKTLSGLARWIIEQANTGNSSALSKITEKNKNVDNTNSVAITSSAKSIVDRESIKKALLQIICDKTGYPQEMLGLDMDLEADLSIDSIKRVEIIGELKTKTDILQEIQRGHDEIVEALASIKTLNGLIDWITESASVDGNPVVENSKLNEKKIQRFTFDFTKTGVDKSKTISIKGCHFIIYDPEKKYSEAIKNKLEGYGAIAEVVSKPDEMIIPDDGFIYLSMESHKDASIDTLVDLLKVVDIKKLKWVYVVSDCIHRLATDNSCASVETLDGFSGFTKSLNRELDATCRAINVECGTTPLVMADIIADELIFEDTQADIYYCDNDRLTCKFLQEEIVPDDNQLSLTRESVILVFGGAQGITSNILKNLSKEFPCRYVLVGRSPSPFDEPVHELSSIFDRDEIRRELVAAKTATSVRELETSVQNIFKRNQIIDTVETLKTNGASVTYLSVDLKSEEFVASMIHDVYAEYGRIDGVIHAAGFLDDKLFSTKSLESFLNVYNTKVTPLRRLIKELKDDVQFIILFSSISSVVGNRGQTDYAAANSVLDAFADTHSDKSKRIVSINWGPWKGSGMVSSTLEKEYARRGIELLPLNEGIESFIAELKYGKNRRVMYMSGDPSAF